MIQKGGYVKDILSKEPGTRLDAYGWVKTRRDSKGVHFVQLQDGSSAQDLQVVIEEGRIPEDKLAHITTGASLRVSGELVKSPAAGQAVELKAEEIEIYGVADPAFVHQRAPTFCFNLPGVEPAAVARGLAAADIGARDGHMYAPRLMERLGLPLETGAVRASLVHYNTPLEIDRFAGALRALAR